MMQTPAISPVAKPHSGASHAKTPDDAGSLPFGDMLNREIADRSAMDTVVAPAKSASNTAKTGQAAAPTNEAATAKDDAAAQAASEDPASNAPVAQNTATTEAGNGKPAADEKKDDDAQDMLSAASNELIALVANMNQPRATASDGASAVDADADAAADAKKDDALIATVDAKNADANTQQVQDDTAALAAAALAQTQTGTQPAPTAEPDTDFGKTLAAGGTTTPAAVPLASGNSKQQPIVAPTPMERSLVMSMKPGESQLKAGMGAKGKRAADAAPTEVEAKAEPSAGKNAATETLAAATPSARSEAAATPAPATVSTAKDTMPQHDAVPTPAVAGLTAASAAALNQVQAAAAQFVDNLAPRVGTQEWNQALGQKVVWMANGEQQSASLTLNPPDLGPLQVVLSVTNNHATANFTSAQPEVRQALESAMPKLREMLSDAGIQLGQANVNAGTPNSQQNAFQSSSQQSSRHGASGTSSDNTVDAPVRVSHVRAAKGGAGLVDTFA